MIGLFQGQSPFVRRIRASKAFVGGIFQPGRVDHPEPKIAKILAFALAPVTGHARRMSSTIASRLPTNRLNSVDLPTLGRPIIATVNSVIFSRR